MTTEIINSLSPELPPATTDAANANDVHRRFRFALRQQRSVIARSGNTLKDPVSIVEVTAGKR